MSEPHHPVVPPPPSRWRPDRDLVVSIAAIVLSVSALGVSLVQTAVMRAQQYAAVWPRLTTVVDIYPTSFRVSVRNAGVGPAQIVWAQGLLDGVPLHGWAALVARAAAVAPDTAHAPPRTSIASLSDDVLIAGERKVLLGVDGPIARGMTTLTPHVGLRICYCSVFDRCWQLENLGLADPSASDRIVPVSRCDRPTTPLI